MQKRQVLLPIACLLFLATGLLGIDRLATAQDQTRDVAFNTPEEAITFYMQGVTLGDVSQIMEACAINEMGGGFNFELYTNRLQALTFQSPAPSDYPLYAEMNKVQFSWQILMDKSFSARIEWVGHTWRGSRSETVWQRDSVGRHRAS